MVKIKLLIEDTQSCVPLDLNKIAGNVHMFKLTGALLFRKCYIKEKLDLGCTRNRLEQCPCNIK